MPLCSSPSRPPTPRRPTWATCSTSTPTGCRSSPSPSAPSPSSTPRPPTSAARPRSCSTSTPSGWRARGRATRPTSASRSTSTTGRTPPRPCSASRWPTCSAPPAAAAARPRQELADSAIPLEIAIPVLPCRGGADVAHRLFEPLGWSVEAEPIPLDEAFEEWGDSRYVQLRLTGTLRLADALNQLHVLLPVLDESKHYWQGADEVDKLMRSGEGWLADHPEATLITRRYLGRSSGLTRTALARLAELGDDLEEAVEPAEDEEVAAARGEARAAQRPAARRGPPGPARPRRPLGHRPRLRPRPVPAAARPDAGVHPRRRQRRLDEVAAARRPTAAAWTG